MTTSPPSGFTKLVAIRKAPASIRSSPATSSASGSGYTCKKSCRRRRSSRRRDQAASGKVGQRPPPSNVQLAPFLIYPPEGKILLIGYILYMQEALAGLS